MPVEVQGFHADRSVWTENTQTDDISAGGVRFPLQQDVELGQVLRLDLPLPTRLRKHDLTLPSYRVYALVRGIQYEETGRRVGVMFLGQFAPRGFQTNPTALFLLPGDAPPAPQPPPSAFKDPSASHPPGSRRPREPSPPALVPEAPGGVDRRLHPRVNAFVNFTLQQVDEFGAVLQEELTVADNVSSSGAHVMTTLAFAVGEIVLVQEAGGGFATRAEVRGAAHGADGIRRLHLYFLDRPAPDRILMR
jgi:hypothetical protein